MLYSYSESHRETSEGYGDQEGAVISSLCVFFHMLPVLHTRKFVLYPWFVLKGTMTISSASVIECQWSCETPEIWNLENLPLILYEVKRYLPWSGLSISASVRVYWRCNSRWLCVFYRRGLVLLHKNCFLGETASFLLQPGQSQHVLVRARRLLCAGQVVLTKCSYWLCTWVPETVDWRVLGCLVEEVRASSHNLVPHKKFCRFLFLLGEPPSWRALASASATMATRGSPARFFLLRAR